MAKIVAAYGLPHTPFFPSKVVEEGPASPTGKMFAPARDSLFAAKPDVTVIFDTDHYNTFFFDNFPILAIGIDEKFLRPIDEPRGGMPVYSVPSMPKLADALHTPEERKALLAGDVVTPHNMGVNDFMMGYLARFGACGLSVPLFNEKIRAVPH